MTSNNLVHRVQRRVLKVLDSEVKAYLKYFLKEQINEKFTNEFANIDVPNI